MKSVETYSGFKSREYHVPSVVDVYQNLNTGGLSVRGVEEHRGLVIDHVDCVSLSECVFLVSDSGRKRVIETGVKNVHAYVRGSLQSFEYTEYDIGIRYNPFKNASFATEEGSPVGHADSVSICVTDHDSRFTASNARS
mgnify:CR=1 FL=1